MSTHEHLVVTDTLGVLPEFLRELHRLVTLGTKVLRKWEGAVWDSDRACRFVLERGRLSRGTRRLVRTPGELHCVPA